MPLYNLLANLLSNTVAWFEIILSPSPLQYPGPPLVFSFRLHVLHQQPTTELTSRPWGTTRSTAHSGEAKLAVDAHSSDPTNPSDTLSALACASGTGYAPRGSDKVSQMRRNVFEESKYLPKAKIHLSSREYIETESTVFNPDRLGSADR